MLPKHLKNLIMSFLFIGFILPSITNAQSNDDCLMCHSDNDLTMEKKGKEISLFVDENVLNRSAHSKLNCISCHSGFDAEDIPHKDPMTQVNCVSCHQASLTKHQFHPQILKAGGRGTNPDINCQSCHGIHDVIKVERSKWSRNNIPVSCGQCHKDASDKYQLSNHFKAFKDGEKSAPDCIYCHKTNITESSGKSRSELKIAQEKLCLSCHLDDPEIRRRTTPSAGFIQAYDNSVHGKSLHAGNAEAAACIDCHKAHDVIKAVETSSSVNRMNIATTCGTCHQDIANEYNESIHGMAVLRGNNDSPTCTYCHGEHNILDHLDPNAPVAFQNVSLQLCSPCHESVRLSERYGLAANRYSTFKDSYHGLALRGGSATVANCGSCHGVHNIKPSTDPTSLIHKDNLVATCGSCHPGANEVFTKGSIHVTLDRDEEPILYWIAYLYIMLIVSVIGGMFLHNAIDLYRKAKIKRLRKIGKMPHEKHGHALYLRMTVNERIQHATMAISFIVLVITGFMLRYPDSWWVKHITDISTDAFVYRSLIHRIAAVAMVAVCFYHIYYILFTKRGRQLVVDLLPRWKDFTDAIGVAKFNLGISKTKPELDRFSYVEKAEYWALVWGTIVMTVTGLLMWIYTDIAGSFTKTEWDIARTIHYYEAWLAFLAIVVWHFYFVIFNPDIYPMSLAWLKGTISEEEMADEHPLELKRIKKEQREKEGLSSINLDDDED
ncbi:MAG TPA: cytochrome b/b6 domain-containing protein [Ignavibacteriaceae bacterium]|nr:cytochrome b/b6 domain-containing protein [Ignavibacteriaceae bacterium]